MAYKQVKKTPRLVVKDSDPAQAEAYRKKTQMKEVGDAKVEMVFGDMDAAQRKDLKGIIQKLYKEGGGEHEDIDFQEFFSEKLTERIAEYMHDRSKGRTEEQQLASETKRPTNFKATILKAAKARATRRK